MKLLRHRPAVDVLVSLLPRRDRSAAVWFPRGGAASREDLRLFGSPAAVIGSPVANAVDRHPAQVDRPTAPPDRRPAWTARQRTVSSRRYRDHPMNTDR